MTASKPIVYTAIPKFLVFANPIIGAYVENRGFAATTPWQYDYGMGARVDYDDLIESLNTMAVKSDEVWVFGLEAGVFSESIIAHRHGIGLTDGVLREVGLAENAGTPVRYFQFDLEEHTIVPVHPDHPPDPEGKFTNG